MTTEKAVNTVYVVAPPARKSMGVAFLLGFFFGPFGMFYTSATAGIVSVALWLVIGLPLAFLTFGVGLVVWFFFGFLGIALANGKNKKNDFIQTQQVNALQAEELEVASEITIEVGEPVSTATPIDQKPAEANAIQAEELENAIQAEELENAIQAEELEVASETTIEVGEPVSAPTPPDQKPA